MDRITLGKEGEKRAVRFLEKMGCVILERNFRCRYGEIDVIALDHGTLCFVEVKTRSRTDYGLPCESVSRRKEHHIKRCAYLYIREHRLQEYAIRIDIIEVLFIDNQYHVRRIINGRDSW